MWQGCIIFWVGFPLCACRSNFFCKSYGGETSGGTPASQRTCYLDGKIGKPTFTYWEQIQCPDAIPTTTLQQCVGGKSCSSPELPLNRSFQTLLEGAKKSTAIEIPSHSRSVSVEGVNVTSLPRKLVLFNTLLRYNRDVSPRVTCYWHSVCSY